MKKPIREQVDQATPSPSPIRIPKAYFMLPELRELVIMTIRELAPNGVGSHSEYRSLLSQALTVVENRLSTKISNFDIMSNVGLTLSHIDRELSKVPYESIFEYA